MPASTKAKNPSNIEITFTESDHSYISIVDGKEISYTSGTSFLHNYFPEFDPTGRITAACARKEGCTVEEIKRRWKEKADNSCIYGTRVHETIEDQILGRDYRNTPKNLKEERAFEHAKNMGEKIKKKIEVLGVEKIVFDHRLKIAGTIDLFGRSKNGTYLIIDHKTNERIDQDNKYNSFALDPISHIPNINFYHYGLQLNLYSFMLKFGDYVPANAKFRYFLNHITEGGAKLIELPDLQNEIKDLVLDHIKKS